MIEIFDLVEDIWSSVPLSLCSVFFIVFLSSLLLVLYGLFWIHSVSDLIGLGLDAK